MFYSATETRIKYMDNGLQKCLQFGITGNILHTDNICIYICMSVLCWRNKVSYIMSLSFDLRFALAVHTNDRNSSWKLYQRLQGKLKLRVYLTPDHCEIGKAGTPLPGTKDGLLSCDRVKVFSDGSLGAVSILDKLSPSTPISFDPVHLLKNLP